MLRTAMGPAIAEALADRHVIEIMVNPDGALRLDRLGEGRTDAEVRIDAARVERIIRLVASHERGDLSLFVGNLPCSGEAILRQRLGLAQKAERASWAGSRRATSGRSHITSSHFTGLFARSGIVRINVGAWPGWAPVAAS